MAFHDKIDWTGVDWTHTNAEIAASLGGVRRETVSRERVRLGHAKVYPRPSDRIDELERENAELRAKLAMMTASPIMDAVRARPGLAHVKGTDAELLRWVLRSGHGWEPGQVRWSHVRDMAGHGSTVGHALCVAVGVNPDDVAPQDDGENCPRCGSLLERGFIVGLTLTEAAELRDELTRALGKIARKADPYHGKRLTIGVREDVPVGEIRRWQKHDLTGEPIDCYALYVLADLQSQATNDGIGAILAWGEANPGHPFTFTITDEPGDDSAF